MDPKKRTASIAELRSQLRSTDFLHTPAQVRVAPQTASLHPSSAQAGAPVQQHAPVPTPAPAASAQPSPQPATPPARTASKPAAAPGRRQQQKPAQASQSQQRKGSSKVFLIVVLIMTVIGGAIGLNVYNDIMSFFSQQQEAPELAPARPLPLEVEVLAPPGADNAAVLDALRNAYQQEVQAQYPGAVISGNIPVTAVGSWQQVGQEGGQVRYRATMQGYVALPQGP
jgi:hypothetical protein